MSMFKQKGPKLRVKWKYVFVARSKKKKLRKIETPEGRLLRVVRGMQCRMVLLNICWMERNGTDALSFEIEIVI